MTDELHTPELLFTEENWEAETPGLTRAMNSKLASSRTPVFRDHGDYGEGWGTGGFVDVGGSRYVLTNQHVATVRKDKANLGIKFEGLDDLSVLGGEHFEQPWPWDLGLIPISETVWDRASHGSVAISVEEMGLAHTPFPQEIFAFSGYSGEQTQFHFGSLFFGATTSLSREVPLPDDKRWDDRLHFGLSYRPDLATTVVGDKGLPTPPGLSGSIVWNTCFVEARAKGLTWSPDLARVAGVVWGWSSSHGLVLATKVEHVRSFLLGATDELGRAP